MIDLAQIPVITQKASLLNGFCFTTDVDWASDVAIEYLVKFFEQKNIPLTMFVTHYSPFIQEKIKANSSNLEVGIHPNFIQPSTQGANIEEIINYCHKIHPQAKALRCHRWFSSNDIYDKLLDIGIKYESNTCTAFNLVKPFINRAGLISFPTFFEDGAYLYHKLNLSFASTKNLYQASGLYVINLHPMHFVVNTPYFQYMRDIKDSMNPHDWNNLSQENIFKFSYTGLGIRNYIEELVNYVLQRNIPTYTLNQVYELIVR